MLKNLWLSRMPSGQGSLSRVPGPGNRQFSSHCRQHNREQQDRQSRSHCWSIISSTTDACCSRHIHGVHAAIEQAHARSCGTPQRGARSRTSQESQSPKLQEQVRVAQKKDSRGSRVALQVPIPVEEEREEVRGTLRLA
ncbi:unnamed protein product [Pieris macdunnoughi]|uniref:Uncharacterized protein n=1 Tax=Pieris macdunnoughi TaxID=345717 RepID=A0A821XDM3_9NEOP|nr:unnamed protein product [Pieris macdunnoughi]